MQLPTTSSSASRVAQQIRDASLLALYGTWKSARTGLTLPTLESLNLEHGSTLDRVFVTELVDLAPFTLRTTYLGSTLSTQLGRGLGDSDVFTADNEDILGGLEATYRRCVRLQEPSYESMRFKQQNGKHTSFERLLLPCVSADGSLHYLVGMVSFENLTQS